MDFRDLINTIDSIAHEAKDKEPQRLTIQDVMPAVDKIVFSPPSATMIKYSSANNPAFADKDVNDPKIKAELFNAEIKQSPGRLMGDIAARIKPTDDTQIEISNLMNSISDKIAGKNPITKDESTFVMAVMKKALKDMPLEKDPDQSKYDDNEGEDDFESVQHEDDQLDEIPIGAVASGIGRGVAAGAKAVGGAAVKGAQAVGRGAVAGAKAVGKMTQKGVQGLRRVAGQMKMGNQTSRMITGLNALMTKGTAQGMGAQGLQQILGPIQKILNDPQLSTEFIRLLKKAEAKAGQQQMQTNDIHNESVQFDEVVDYDLIESIFEKYHSEVTEGDNIYHPCTKSFKHDKFGEGEVLHGEHTLSEDGTVTHYDAKFVREDGSQFIVRNIPVANMKECVVVEHSHAPKKKKVKKEEIEIEETWFQDMIDVTLHGDEFYETFGWVGYDDESIEEAEYQGRSVKLNKPMRGDVKKFKVYVKNPKGNVVKVNFGDPDMKIKRSIPARRKSFRARHNCDSPGPKTKARYWSCKKW